MNAESMTDTDILALAGLALHLASADGRLSAEEAEELGEIGLEIGGSDRFSKAITEAERRFKTPAEALDFAAEITDEKTRAFIHTVLSDLANSDELHAAEADLIARVRLMWGIK